MLQILTLNAQASIQDGGRLGYMALGVGRAGAMDILSLNLGNVLLGNEPNLPALEIALGGMSVQFHHDTTICLTGAIFDGDINGKPFYNGYRTNIKAGDVLTLYQAKYGMYGYLCVAGGFDVPTELGSASCDAKAGLGGGMLSVGDSLPYHASAAMSVLGVANCYRLHDSHHEIQVLPSSESTAFKDSIDGKSFTISPKSSRMGYRLDGEPMELIAATEMNSHGVQMGMIQVPPDGQPIVLMADAQTTGGYPKIASVITAHLGKMAQLRFGQTVTFKVVDMDTAHQAWQNHQNTLSSLAKTLAKHDHTQTGQRRQTITN